MHMLTILHSIKILFILEPSVFVWFNFIVLGALIGSWRYKNYKNLMPIKQRKLCNVI